jgi:DNA-binding GntR family transcriptional regulator
MFGVKNTTQIIQSAGMKVRTEVLHFERRLPSEDVAEKLGISERDPVPSRLSSSLSSGSTLNMHA